MAEITSAKAMARTVRVSPRKSRLVLDNIRGKSVADAIAILTFTPNKAAGIILKVLNSAVETFPSSCKRFSFTNQQTYSSHHSSCCRKIRR